MQGSLSSRRTRMVAAQAPQLRMTTVERNGVVCLRPEGELDLGTMDALRARLDDLDRLHKTVRLDLGGLTFLATSGLGVLVDANARARELGSCLTFYHGRPEVERMVKLSGVDRLLNFEPSWGRPESKGGRALQAGPSGRPGAALGSRRAPSPRRRSAGSSTCRS